MLMSVRPARMNSSRNAVASAVSASAIGIERRHERAEDDEQHDDRREQAEQLLRALLDRRELGVAVVLDRHAGRLDRLADGVLHGDDGVAILLEDDPVELRLRVGDAPVVGERVLAERIADALDPGLVLGRRLNSVRLQLRDRRPRSRPCARACRAARPPARRRRGSGRRPARRRTRTRSGRSPSACPSPGSRTRPSGCRRPSRPGRSAAAMMPTQPTTTRHGCVAQARVQRASAPVERRSWAARRSDVGCSVIAFLPPSRRVFPLLTASDPELIGRRAACSDLTFYHAPGRRAVRRAVESAPLQEDPRR